jgi:hypothetical protein
MPTALPVASLAVTASGAATSVAVHRAGDEVVS